MAQLVTEQEEDEGMLLMLYVVLLGIPIQCKQSTSLLQLFRDMNELVFVCGGDHDQHGTEHLVVKVLRFVF